MKHVWIQIWNFLSWQIFFNILKILSLLTCLTSVPATGGCLFNGPPHWSHRRKVNNQIANSALVTNCHPFYKQTCSVLTLGSTLLILILAKFFSFFLNQCFITASAQSGVNPSRDAGMGGAVLDIFPHSAHLHSPETDQRPVNKWLFVVRTRAFILSLSPLTAPLTSDRLCHNSALTAWAKSGRVSRSKWNSNRPCNLKCQLSPPVPFSWLLRSWPALTCLGC